MDGGKEIYAKNSLVIFAKIWYYEKQKIDRLRRKSDGI